MVDVAAEHQDAGRRVPARTVENGDGNERDQASTGPQQAGDLAPRREHLGAVGARQEVLQYRLGLRRVEAGGAARAGPVMEQAAVLARDQQEIEREIVVGGVEQILRAETRALAFDELLRIVPVRPVARIAHQAFELSAEIAVEASRADQAVLRFEFEIAPGDQDAHRGELGEGPDQNDGGERREHETTQRHSAPRRRGVRRRGGRVRAHRSPVSARGLPP